jgi:prophage regulatory protein
MSTKAIRRMSTVNERSGYSRSAIYQQISEGLWPRPVRLGKRAVGWPDDELEALIGARIAGCSDEEIRTLVAKLEAARPGSFSTYNPNNNPKVIEGQKRFIADVRAKKRPAPRAKRGPVELAAKPDLGDAP